MSPEERRIFNARRASALRKTRLKDEELCQLYESAQANGTILDEATMKEVCNFLVSLKNGSLDTFCRNIITPDTVL